MRDICIYNDFHYFHFEKKIQIIKKIPSPVTSRRRDAPAVLPVLYRQCKKPPNGLIYVYSIPRISLLYP
jgi:hypothetical protein